MAKPATPRRKAATADVTQAEMNLRAENKRLQEYFASAQRRASRAEAQLDASTKILEGMEMMLANLRKLLPDPDCPF